jgi:uncharacterized membrane protein
MPLARRHVPLLLSASFIALFALRLWLTFDALPEIMASHFDGSGRPNGYQHRAAFAAISVGLSVGCLLLFAVLPVLLRKLPASLINLPHREYWLTPERKAESVALLCGYLDWFACATMALLVAVFELVLRANLARAALGSVAIWLLLACYLGFTLSWSVALWRAFRLPAAAA